MPPSLLLKFLVLLTAPRRSGEPPLPGGGGLSTQSLPSKEGPGTIIFLSGACPLHPALGSVLPGVWSSHLLCACSGWRQLDTGPGPPVSYHRKGFQAQPRPRDKRTSVHPLVPSPSFLKQHSFMRVLPSPAAPACHTLPPFRWPVWRTCLFALQHAGFLLFFTVLSPCTLRAHPLYGGQDEC